MEKYVLFFIDVILKIKFYRKINLILLINKNIKISNFFTYFNNQSKIKKKLKKTKTGKWNFTY